MRRRRGICAIGDGHGIAGRRRGHHELPRGRIRIPSRGRTAHMRAFVTEGEPAVRTGLRGIGRKLEGGRDGIIAGVDLDALPGEDSVEVVEVEERVVTLEEGFALEELAALSSSSSTSTVTLRTTEQGFDRSIYCTSLVTIAFHLIWHTFTHVY